MMTKNEYNIKLFILLTLGIISFLTTFALVVFTAKSEFDGTIVTICFISWIITWIIARAMLKLMSYMNSLNLNESLYLIVKVGLYVAFALMTMNYIAVMIGVIE